MSELEIFEEKVKSKNQNFPRLSQVSVNYRKFPKIVTNSRNIVASLHILRIQIPHHYQFVDKTTFEEYFFIKNFLNFFLNLSVLLCSMLHHQLLFFLSIFHPRAYKQKENRLEKYLVGKLYARCNSLSIRIGILDAVGSFYCLGSKSASKSINILCFSLNNFLKGGHK